MAVIEFRTLGTLDLRRTDGSELHSLLAQPKRIALLAYLCLAKPRGFRRRDTLLGLFWPDADQAHARTSLRNALHVLRHSLGETALLSRGDEEIAVNFDAVWCDAVAFEEQTASEEIDGALALYRGDFLSGFFLDDVPALERWLDGERISLRATAARAARVAAERRELEGNLTGAISLARRSVELTDTDERAVRRLVELLARVGDRAGALQAYENFERHLATEFDAEPSAETRTLVDRLRGYPNAQAKVNTSQTSVPVDVPPPPKPGIPGYSIEQELGRGGTSTVFLARDLKHDRPVAIKILRPDVVAVLGTDRFLSEIVIAARLHHPHILPLLDSGKASGLPYYVMPYVEGESLRGCLRRERFLPIQDAIRIATQVADALAYAHGRGIIHRDIKPDNILLENGHALVTDFGIARAISEAGGERLTETGLAVGTAAYMSPEQADSAVEIDARADIYALGCVLYEMLTGDPPFVGSSAQAILARKATEPAPQMRTVRETIPIALERNVLKALSRAPSDRFRHVNEFAAAIAAPQPSLQESQLNGALAMVRRSWRKGSGLLAGSAVVVIATGGAAFFVASREARATRSYPVARQITYSGRASKAAISPDGQYLAYTVADGDSQHVMVQDLAAAGAPNQIATITQTTTMEWSPTGTRLLVGSFDPERSRGLAFTIPRNGGEKRKLAVAGTIGANIFAYWLPDRVSDESHVTINADPDKRLLRVDLQSEDTLPIPLRGRDDGSIYGGEWSPVGKFFAGTVRSVNPIQWEIGIFGRDGTSHIIVEDSLPLGPPRWSATGDGLYYARGSESLWHVSVSPATGMRAGTPEEIGHDFEFLTDRFHGLAGFGITRDGHRLAYPRGRRYSNIWLVGAGGRLPVQLTTGTALRWSPTVSPDGKWIAFAQQTGERAELFRMPVDGGSPSQITFGANVVPRGSVAWSPDGQSLAYGSIGGGRSQVWIATLETGQTRPIRQSYLSAFRGHVAWAPGRQIAYLNTGQTGIQLADPTTGNVREIVPSFGWSILQSPKSSPDGRHVAAAWNRGAGDFGVWVFDVADSASPRKVADGWLWPAAWSPDGRYVYASLYNIPTLYRIDTEEHRPPVPVISPLNAWRRVDQNTPAREMECTLAGKLRPDAFICTVFDFVSDIWIIDNFEALKN